MRVEGKAGVLIAAASMIGAAWVMNRRRMYRPSAGALGDTERAMLEPYFSAEVLARTRVARVERISNPLAYRVLPLIGRSPPMDLEGVSGMALADTIVLAEPRRGINFGGLLFHEMVHIVQYELLGVRGFVAAYLRGWLGSGRNYFGIPLERQAFALQDRFLSSTGVFDVREELERLLQDETRS